MNLKKIRYRFLSHVTFGKMKEHYKRKYKLIKQSASSVSQQEKITIKTEIKKETVYIVPPQKRNVLIIFLDAIGDYILFRNFLSEIRESSKFKDYTITLLGCEKFKDFALYCDGNVVDKFLWVPHRSQNMSLEQWEKIRKDLHEQQGMNHYYDTIILASYNSAGKREVIEYFLKYVVSREKIIYVEWRNPKIHDPNNFLNYTYVYVNHANAFEKFEFDLNKDFWEDILGKKISLSYPKIQLENIQSDYIHPEKKYIVINPCAQDKYRMWNIQNYVELIQYFTKKDFHIILCCAKSEESYCKQLAEKCLADIEIRAGLSVPDLLATLKSSALYIGQDSGCFHIAAACDIKALCLSAGNAYFRFMNYPRNRQNIKILFPYGIEEEIKKNPQLVVDHKGFFINSIKVKNVIFEAEKLLQQKF